MAVQPALPGPTVTPPYRRRRRDHATHTDLNLVAMIDVVFLLLMYFLLATNFTLGEELYRIELPQSLGTAADPDPFDLPDQPVIIKITSTGPGKNSYLIRLDLGNTQPTSFEKLYTTLRDWKAGPGNSAGILFPDTPIIIQPDRSCRYEHAINVLNACIRAQYENVQFVDSTSP